MRNYLIAYDVKSMAKRNAIAGKLEKAGRRIQKSVFIVRIGEKALKNLERELQSIVDVSDSLLLVPLCQKSLSESVYIGELPPLLILA